MPERSADLFYHDLICYADSPPEGETFCGLPGPIGGIPPNETTVGGSFYYQDETMLRWSFGPEIGRIPCDTAEFGTVYVQNDPGMGLSGDYLSNGVPMRFYNISTDVPANDQRNFVRAVRGGNDVQLSWDGAPAMVFAVFRDPAKRELGLTEVATQLEVTAHTDIDAILRPDTDFYYLRGLSPCTFTPGP